MNYLVDTNIISELRKSNCDRKVKVFMESLPSESLYISVISLGEISYGITRLENAKKKDELTFWLDTELVQWFEGRIISIDADIAITWGTLRANHKGTLPAYDSLLAAAALKRHLTILTRNVKDFETIEGIMVINPFQLGSVG